jgi:hypothetical protein
MAAITVTPANVGLGGGSGRTVIGMYGEAVTQGEVVYRSSTDSKYYLSDANLLAGAASGIALTPGSTNEYGVVALPGTTPGQAIVNVGATLVVGMVYCVGATAGEIVPYADLTTNDYVTIVGVAKTAALLDLMIIASGTQKP